MGRSWQAGAGVDPNSTFFDGIGTLNPTPRDAAPFMQLDHPMAITAIALAFGLRFGWIEKRGAPKNPTHRERST